MFEIGLRVVRALRKFIRISRLKIQRLVSLAVRAFKTMPKRQTAEEKRMARSLTHKHLPLSQRCAPDCTKEHIDRKKLYHAYDGQNGHCFANCPCNEEPRELRSYNNRNVARRTVNPDTTKSTKDEVNAGIARLLQTSGISDADEIESFLVGDTAGETLDALRERFRKLKDAMALLDWWRLKGVRTIDDLERWQEDAAKHQGGHPETMLKELAGMLVPSGVKTAAELKRILPLAKHFQGLAPNLLSKGVSIAKKLLRQAEQLKDATHYRVANDQCENHEELIGELTALLAENDVNTMDGTVPLAKCLGGLLPNASEKCATIARTLQQEAKPINVRVDQKDPTNVQEQHRPDNTQRSLPLIERLHSLGVENVDACTQWITDKFGEAWLARDLYCRLVSILVEYGIDTHDQLNNLTRTMKILQEGGVYDPELLQMCVGKADHELYWVEGRPPLPQDRGGPLEPFTGVVCGVGCRCHVKVGPSIGDLFEQDAPVRKRRRCMADWVRIAGLALDAEQRATRAWVYSRQAASGASGSH